MKRLELLLLLPGIVWVMGGALGAAASSKLPRSHPISEKTVPKISSETSASPNTAVSAPLPTLQAHLDSICEQKLEERCKSTQDDFCNTKPVARKGVGTLPEQADAAWRCYGNLSYEEDKRDVTCIDSCGVMFKCLGSVPLKSLHMTVPELETAISDNLKKFCSPFQKLLNDYCNNLKEGWVARKGVLREEEGSKKWRCYDVAVLEYERSSQCLDNCGAAFPCRGSRLPADRSSLKEGSDFSTIDDADEQLSTVERTCTQDQVCTRTLQNPPKCVLPHEAEAAREEAEAEEEQYAARAAEKDEEHSTLKETDGLKSRVAGKETPQSDDTGFTGPPQDLRLGSPVVHAEEETATRADSSPPGTLSALLSSYCLKEFDYLCETQQLDHFCLDDGDAVVARRDLGRQDGAESPVWRCVEKQKLDKSRSSVCVDACGQAYICPGGIDTENTVHAVWPQLEILVKEKATELCAKFNGGLAGGTASFTG